MVKQREYFVSMELETFTYAVCCMCEARERRLMDLGLPLGWAYVALTIPRGDRLLLTICNDCRSVIKIEIEDPKGANAAS